MKLQPLFFKKAGKLMFTKYVNGVLTRNSTNSYFRNGAVQSIVPTVNVKTTPLPDGNSDWDAAEPDTGKEGSLVINLSFMPIELYAWFMGTTVEALTNKQMWAVDEELLVPEASPYQVTLEHTPALGTTMLVDQDASAWAKTASVSAVPTQAEYTVSATAVIFNSADAGKSVFITYDWTALTADSFGLPKAGSRSVMECIISGEASSEDESSTVPINMVVDRCKTTGNINPPEMGREPKPTSITLKVLKPRGSNKAIDIIRANS
jgi:hypothetical protein